MSKDKGKRTVKEEETTLFKELEIKGFTEAEVKLLTDLFSVLANDKRLDILRTTIAENVTRLKDLAKELGEKNSAQIALHAKKLYDAGLLKKEGKSLKETSEYVPTIAKETYVFLRIALIYARMLQSRQTELELERLKVNAEAASERLAESPILASTLSFSEIPTQYDESLRVAHKSFGELVSLFAKIVNTKEL